MRITEYSSKTDCPNGVIGGSFHLNSGSKRVAEVEMSIPYFNWDFNASHCEFNCADLTTGYAMGNFVKVSDLQGASPVFAGCFGANFAREVDWYYPSLTTIDDDIKYYISIPRTQCDMNYDYCIKVLIRYDDCTCCECTFCFTRDRVYCSCEPHKDANSSNGGQVSKPSLGENSVKISPNPNGGEFSIAMDKTTDAKVITLVDMTGKIIAKAVVAGELAKYDVTNVAPGTYNVVITANGSTVTKKVVITK
jgi:hypothetical protein